MVQLKKLWAYLKEWISIIQIIKTLASMTLDEKDQEILALRSQLALTQEKIKNKKIPKPKSTLAFRQLWVILSLIYAQWRQVLAYFQPATVKKWHESAFKVHWNEKSRAGRPPISREMINRIKQLHKENPHLSAKKLHELMVNLGIKDAPTENTIRKYVPTITKPPSEKQRQAWKMFLKNHAKDIWAMDFFTVPTLRFKILYVFVIIHHESRKIQHMGVTSNPDSRWVKQQLAQATPYDHYPKYLIHDRDPLFMSDDFQDFLTSTGITSKPITAQSPWQNGIAERVIGIFRQELLNYIIPLHENHLKRVLKTYIEDYYHPHRTHQGLNCRTPDPSPLYFPTKLADSKLASKEVLGGLYHTYTKIS